MTGGDRVHFGCAMLPSPGSTARARNSRRRRCVLASGLSLLVAACQAPAPAPKTEPLTLVERRLADSGDRIASALEQLQRLEAASNSAPIPEPIDLTTVPEDLLVTITWHEPGISIQSALRGVAAKLGGGYRVIVHGVEPTAPIEVKIDADKMPAISLLESIGLQVGNRATVRPDPAGQAIHLYFTPPAVGLRQ
jgi:defect-in-organelle-trafficking protein DotD